MMNVKHMNKNDIIPETVMEELKKRFEFVGLENYGKPLPENGIRATWETDDEIRKNVFLGYIISGVFTKDFVDVYSVTKCVRNHGG